MKEKLPLLNELIKYHKENNLILSMPGNKCGKGFLRDGIGENFVRNLGFLDITEVDPLDNLHCPEGVIKDSQELLSKYYKAKKGYFLVNGSSSGNLAAIFSAFNEGDEILVERNCHKSVYNAIILRKLKVIYIEGNIDENNGIFLPPNNDNIYKALKRSKNPKGIILTYPNYFGITYNLENILKNLKSSNLKIIIDGAHGAHFGVTDKLPKSIVNLSDYIVLSAHKTLPSLTQGAYLLTNNEDSNLEFYLKAFTTTSPSYLIMASLDYGRYYLDNYGKEDYEKLITLAEKWKENINSLKKVYILDKEDLIEGYNVDKSRYIITVPKGHNGHKLLAYLRKNKIQAEMSFQLGVVLMLSSFNTDEDFFKIFNAIKALDLSSIYEGKSFNKVYSFIGEKKMEPYEVFNKDFEEINIEDSEGRVCKDSIIPYPPGIPLLCAGEVINKEVILIIKDYIYNNINVIGIYKDKVNVVR
ncbi:aminotransferase class I/II-fold pyridoxal phosphate-dependent enzyme [Clostridium septicum]|uniref:aminotransferase class I/II-fold pyridoxal phosphate-dependent enzyme n=1 Tax=Clostridium septicum TaxID=1504 RepID=UPI000837573E|nr:aminotransferase class I/II-fold pyridoxal phosphate-dependent enzyme [Clostridium septicum]